MHFINKYKITVLVIFIFIINFSFFSYYKTYTNALEGGDSWGYYTYLASTFIYHDLGDYRTTVAATQKRNPNFGNPYIDKYGIKESPTNNYIIKYTSGVAIVLSPFFFLAHIYCKFYDPDIATGFTVPYAFMLGIGIMLWCMLAQIALSKVLLRYFKWNAVLFTIIAIVLGANIFYNTACNFVMSHALLFSFYSFLIYFTDQFYRNNKLRNLFFMGITVSFIILIRPNEIYCLLIPIFYNITNFEDIKQRFAFFKAEYKKLLMIALCSLAIFIPQIIYWKTFAGSFIYNGYTGESFDFWHPHIFDGLFSYANGWLVWSPIMALSIAGLLLLNKYAKHIFWLTIFILPLHIYIIYSWWCYTYINGFGSRPMEHLYPLLSFAFASFFTFMCQFRIPKLIAILIIFCAIGLNIFQTWQFTNGILRTELTNKGYYWGIFGKTNFSKKAIIAYASGEIQSNGLKPLHTLYSNNFNDINNLFNCKMPQHTSLMRCLKNRIDTITTITLNKKIDSKYLIIKFKNLFPSNNVYSKQWECPLIILRHLDKNGNTLYDSNMRPHIITGNETYTIWSNGKADTCDQINYNIKIAHRHKTTQIVVCTWNPTLQPFYIDDLQIMTAE